MNGFFRDIINPVLARRLPSGLLEKHTTSVILVAAISVASLGISPLAVPLYRRRYARLWEAPLRHAMGAPAVTSNRRDGPAQQSGPVP
jgi:hypothetical protein